MGVRDRTVSLRAAIAAPLVVVACLVAAASGGANLGPTGSPASAGGPNRAVVVVDTGSGSRAACVLFDEESISGTEALQRAGMAPVMQGFGGQGAAVCSLNGVGCPSDGSCLTCQAPNYWAYFRSSGGGFSYSSAGAGSTQVTDGDIEGWRWGTGAAPALRSVDSVCGAEAPPPTTAPTAAPAPPSGGSAPVAPYPSAADLASGGEPGATTTTAPLAATTSTTAAGQTAEASDGDAQGSRDEVDDGSDEQATVSITEDDGGGSAAGSIALASAALGGIGFFVWRARRRRSTPADSV